MIIKLDTSALRLVRPKEERAEKIATPLTRAQWINADRIVMAVMFAVIIIGAIVF
ncbi:hypothetical protein QWY86_00705 [Pedobacter aquatilis]|uniref:hypothetical protein n=1 Tax=Pedobacter aquatilis TaxID=351343 RepID=UPI0025B54C64|nr:hypothetical protein [Pedobacter aquatilis]MDN3585167.1 hypothetical protein [Pedobacter aquatilis]